MRWPPWRRRPQPPSIYDRVTLRVYLHGSTLIGPLTLTELAQLALYSGYGKGGEWSIVNLTEHLGAAADVVDVILPFDVTMEAL